MQTDSDRAVKVLNDLIETTLDSARGYEEAAEHVKDGQLKTMFADRSHKRMAMTRQLQAEVRTFGGEPQTGQSMAGKMHNTFVDLKAALTGGDAKAVIDEVERGEDVIKGKFEKALSEEDLPTAARDAVSRCYQSIRADHDEVSRMKHAMH
jgi:uncharacterized protein (TIGR02284 family)